MADQLTETLARAIHDDYVRRRRIEGRLRPDDPALRSWDDLPASLRRSNIAQARDIWRKLAVMGYDVVPGILGGENVLDPAHLEELSRMEHESWVRHRLADGWRRGTDRDPETMRSPYLIPWDELPESVRQLDRDLILLIPTLLANAGLAVRRSGRAARPPEQTDGQEG